MNIRVAAKADMPAVWELTYKVFLAQGFCEPNDTRQLQRYPHLDGIPETRVLLAEDESGLAGTISVTLDGPHGLHVDESFPGVVGYGGGRCLPAGYRDYELGAVWRLVTRADTEKSPDARRAGEVLKALIDAALQELVKRQLDVVVITVHPGRVGFYQRRLGFEEVTRIDHDPTVNGAPAVLMLGRMETMLKKWKR